MLYFKIPLFCFNSLIFMVILGVAMRIKMIEIALIQFQEKRNISPGIILSGIGLFFCRIHGTVDGTSSHAW